MRGFQAFLPLRPAYTKQAQTLFFPRIAHDML